MLGSWPPPSSAQLRRTRRPASPVIGPALTGCPASQSGTATGQQYRCRPQPMAAPVPESEPDHGRPCTLRCTPVASTLHTGPKTCPIDRPTDQPPAQPPRPTKHPTNSMGQTSRDSVDHGRSNDRVGRLAPQITYMSSQSANHQAASGQRTRPPDTCLRSITRSTSIAVMSVVVSQSH